MIYNSVKFTNLKQIIIKRTNYILNILKIVNNLLKNNTENEEDFYIHYQIISFDKGNNN